MHPASIFCEPSAMIESKVWCLDRCSTILLSQGGETNLLGVVDSERFTTVALRQFHSSSRRALTAHRIASRQLLPVSRTSLVSSQPIPNGAYIPAWLHSCPYPALYRRLHKWQTLSLVCSSTIPTHTKMCAGYSRLVVILWLAGSRQANSTTNTRPLPYYPKVRPHVPSTSRAMLSYTTAIFVTSTPAMIPNYSHFAYTNEEVAA
ncbi:hypothetical protein R3P38DRAFT_1569505 [Favolaschia claudopus]|uniref:Uncharacterized protein n=1 Tax=Favolaschia claudopus TaxID=2862362 RepID=A0AAW0AIX3_9AGAR